MAGKGRAKGLNKQSIILMGTIHSHPPARHPLPLSTFTLHNPEVQDGIASNTYRNITVDCSTDSSESASAPRDKGVKTQLKQLL